MPANKSRNCSTRVLGRRQRGQRLLIDQDFDAASDAGLSSDEAGLFEGQRHLMDRGGVTQK